MARIKVKVGENLSKENIKMVISLLEQENPITKKAACEKLNINYSTTRLGRIIEEYTADIEYSKTMRAKLRNTEIGIQEAKGMVEGYLSGDALALLSETTFRSVDKVKEVLLKYNIPLRTEEQDYFNPALINEEGIVENYKEGDLVYATRYNSPAYIRALFSTDSTHGTIYSITLIGDHRRNAYQPYYELADLRALQTELGVTLVDYSQADIQELLMEARRKANSKRGK